MKDILWLNYNLKITSLNEYPRYSSFEWQKDTYYFTKLRISENDFQELLIIVNELLTKNYPVYPFIKNINGIKAQINNTTYLVYLIILNISFKTSNLVQSKSIYINPPLKKKCENKFTH